MIHEIDSEKLAKANLIFKYLKTGKMPKRSNLFKTLFYLSGEIDNYWRITASSSSETLQRPNKNRTVEIRVKDNLNFLNLKKTLSKFIENYEICDERTVDHFCGFYSDGSRYVTIYYNSNNVKWNLIDEELRKNHSNNICEDSGFIKIINYKK